MDIRGDIITMKKSIVAEMGAQDIRTNCIFPGVIDTNMWGVLPAYILEETESATNLRRVCQPYEIAKKTIFLDSDLLTYITGQVIRVDGGI